MKFFSTQYFDRFIDVLCRYGSQNYEYYFLDYMHKKNQRIGATTIIAGSSYAMDGIAVEDMPGGADEVINFSVQSQDLYYDFYQIKMAIQEGKREIQNCIIGLGYYALYQDLSRSKKEGKWIRKVYEPLWGECHHMEPADEPWDRMVGVPYDEKWYPRKIMEPFCEHWIRGVVAESGGNLVGGLVERNEQAVSWQKKTEEERMKAASDRAALHNRLLRYRDTRRENEELIREMVDFLDEYHIVPIFVIFPFSKQYLHCLDPYFKEDFLGCLEKVPMPVELLDMNELDAFEMSDFVDSDHLNEAGAKKATKLLCQFMEMVR